MSEILKNARDFVGYEYKELSAPGDRFSFYLDGYLNFGWVLDENTPQRRLNGVVTVMLKRDRRIVNKAELTRLQRNFDACAEEIHALERAKTTGPLALALTVGVIGTAFMALSVFAVTARPPHIAACVLFAVPGFLGWVLPVFLYRSRVHRKNLQLSPLIEEKLDEACRLCERGHQLLPQ
ncbi:MAG: hypothetical protein Q4C45_00990 [Oscillospiraceae bacterium]|nr:hypothetical protein [Oscillospiraceae bacterium]